MTVELMERSRHFRLPSLAKLISSRKFDKLGKTALIRTHELFTLVDRGACDEHCHHCGVAEFDLKPRKQRIQPSFR